MLADEKGHWKREGGSYLYIHLYYRSVVRKTGSISSPVQWVHLEQKTFEFQVALLCAERESESDHGFIIKIYRFFYI